jgi:hypothetical protein
MVVRELVIIKGRVDFKTDIEYINYIYDEIEKYNEYIVKKNNEIEEFEEKCIKEINDTIKILNEVKEKIK